jgi:diaminopimelate decarboxylase
MTTVAARFGTPACLASTYNLVGRPPLVAVAVAVADARLLVRRETEEDLLTRDIGL